MRIVTGFDLDGLHDQSLVVAAELVAAVNPPKARANDTATAAPLRDAKCFFKWCLLDRYVKNPRRKSRINLYPIGLRKKAEYPIGKKSKSQAWLSSIKAGSE
jgi:hypothetical protein